MVKITDGKAVAKLLVEEYLNNCCSSHKCLMDIMNSQKKEIRENYTYLGYAWLKGLSEVSSYDRRNEASKLLADDICMHLGQEPVLYQIPYRGTTEMDVDLSDDEQVAQVLIGYLSADSSGYQNFVDYALMAHRTLQQNLTRFFLEWFERSNEKSPFIQLARYISSKYALLYI